MEQKLDVIYEKLIIFAQNCELSNFENNVETASYIVCRINLFSKFPLVSSVEVLSVLASALMSHVLELSHSESLSEFEII